MEVNLAFVTNLSEKDAMVREMAQWGDGIYLIRPVEGIYRANYAKLARYYLAAIFDMDVCLIHDIDTVPLQRDYTLSLLENRKPEHLTAIGREVYLGTPHEGKFPVGHLTAEGWLFSLLVENNTPICMFDQKEDYHAHPTIFSDESWLRRQIHLNQIPVEHRMRKIDIYHDWIDRSWWKVDQEKLFAGGYIECNLLRPMHSHREELKPIVDYIDS